MSRSKQILVAATWESEAKVWVAESDDVPGLVVEADSPESLLAKLKTRISELLELNDSLFKEYNSLELRVQYHGEDNNALRGRLMADYSPEENPPREFRENGCRFDRAGKGDHEIWFSPITKPVDHKILSRYTANAVLKQAGIPKAF